LGETITVPDPSDPQTALAAVVALRRLAERLEFAAVQHAVERGWTWAEIAAALGVTRQAAHKRHARRVRRPTGGDR
ncbi:MAG: helix-turn-helix domain-containing protein, partial [Nitriliruptor sp.]